jgi:hypothetical protein
MLLQWSIWVDELKELQFLIIRTAYASLYTCAVGISQLTPSLDIFQVQSLSWLQSRQLDHDSLKKLEYGRKHYFPSLGEERSKVLEEVFIGNFFLLYDWNFQSYQLLLSLAHEQVLVDTLSLPKAASCTSRGWLQAFIMQLIYKSETVLLCSCCRTFPNQLFPCLICWSSHLIRELWSNLLIV